MRRISCSVFSVLTVMLLPALDARAALPNDKMDYRDQGEMVDAMEDLRDDFPGLVTLHSIGSSWDLYSAPGTPTAYDIQALRIGPVGEPEFEDLGDPIPSILFEAGIHGREWLGSESLIELAQYLAARAQDPGTPEYALLKRVAVWILPISNPAGRVIDDLAGGDPEQFHRDPAPANTQYGWRHSGDTRGCAWAVDIARNFSTGWGTASDAGCGSTLHYEGLAPFSTNEASALREFVENHWIGMAIDIHSNTQRLWNRWGDGDVAGKKMRETAVARWGRGLWTLGQRIYDPPAPGSSWWEVFGWFFNLVGFVDAFALDQVQTGTGGGQFTAWLGAEQHMQSFVLELPPNNDRAQTDYYSSELRFDAADRSNTFHPSSSRVRPLIQDAFVPLARYLIGQANAPGCATSVGTVFDGQEAHAVDLREPGGCRYRDYGILAAKIGMQPGEPGMLWSSPASQVETSPGVWTLTVPDFDHLPPSSPNDPQETYKLFYWVQNYSSGRTQTRPSVRIRLRSREHDFAGTDYPTLESSARRDYELGWLEKAYDAFEFRVEEGRDYELSVTVYHRALFGSRLSEDVFRSNNQKAFRFTTVNPFVTP